MSVAGASKDFCALRARVPPRGTLVVVGHTIPCLRSYRRLTGAIHASAPGAALAACIAFTLCAVRSGECLPQGWGLLPIFRGIPMSEYEKYICWLTIKSLNLQHPTKSWGQAKINELKDY